ncbi:MAG: ABC transporter permease, partial [Bacteroidales bacterium]|nr:ABC transporter permease [Bacteroidales bacterium]
MEIIKIAWRNLWRNKVRSLIVIMAVCLGMIGGGFSTALMIGAVNKRIETAIGNETAHVQVNKKGYVDNPDINLLIDNAKEQSEKYLNIDEVQGVSCRLIVNAMMSSTRNATGVNLVGVNPENEKQISSLYTKIENGDFFEEEKRNQIIISKKLAEELNADIRTKLVLSFQDIDGVLTGASFRVSGIYHTGNNMFDQANVFVRRSDLERLTGISNNSAHEIAILFTDNDDLKERTAKISSVSPESVTVRNWEEIMPDLS